MSNSAEILFVSIQATYNDVQVGLFRGQECCEVRSNNTLRASSHLIPEIKALLDRHDYGISDLSFIAIDQGPGAFTSLRVGIATVNGIAFGNRVPLVGVNGLDALALQTLQARGAQVEIVVSLLNAYNDDVYYGLYQKGQRLDQGCMKIDGLVEQLEPYSKKTMLFVGNGAKLHKQKLQDCLGQDTLFEEADVCSAQQVGVMALQQWKNQSEKTFRLMPNYLKTQLFAVRKMA
ncbi:MAG: tRNA (adenosine(37)-N6)-threonylcarbamoyltransferase complex dimerization subunit type 1 TsaB [Epsilonproteobacteria bacterium]|nr:tRNA (adenosine(37)-N6)-threonylcarbamoyltransferase complex dimerization subunit type 1 TsaB [Campylobacterota bacterium]